jgi:hypothetical protein
MMTVAVPIDTAWTASSAAGSRSYAHVVYLGATPARSADPRLGEPESEIDLQAAAEVLLAAGGVEEASSSTLATGSPFGI